jgi:hypothetical protein
MDELKADKITAYAEKAITDIKIIEDKENGKRSVSLELKDDYPLSDIGTTFESAIFEMQYKRLLYRSALISLIIYFESLIAQLFRISFEKNPESIGIQKKTLQYSDIVELGSTEEAKRYLIDKEVEDLMFKGFDEWHDYMTSKLNLKLGYIKRVKGQLTEILVRRNLFVHNDGVANSIYMKKVAEEYRKGIKKGDILNVDKDYMENAISMIERAGVQLVFEKWKHGERQSTRINPVLRSVAFDYMMIEDWETSLELYILAMEDKKIKESERLMTLFNYWQCKKWLGEFESIKDEVNKADCSALSCEYRLSLLALQDNYSEFFKLLPEACPGQLDLNSLKEWPIFRKIREQKEYEEFITKAEANNKMLNEAALTKQFNKEENTLPKIRKLSSKKLYKNIQQ